MSTTASLTVATAPFPSTTVISTQGFLAKPGSLNTLARSIIKDVEGSTVISSFLVSFALALRAPKLLGFAM